MHKCKCKCKWMGAVRMRVQTADKKKHHNNPQVNHTIPVHQLTSCEVKSSVFVTSKTVQTVASS